MTVWIPRLARAALPVVLALGLTVATAARADYADGLAAFERGAFAEAFELWRSAAETGDRNAQHGLGILFETGQGTLQDAAEAAGWYRLAAEQGVVTAQYNLGRLYAEGRGVPQDFTEAARLWLRAAEQNSVTAQHNLGVMYYRGDGVDREPREAAEWFLKAGTGGFPEAQYMLGELHRFGEGVPRDLETARRWLTLAARQGHDRARDALNTLGSLAVEPDTAYVGEGRAPLAEREPLPGSLPPGALVDLDAPAPVAEPGTPGPIASRAVEEAVPAGPTETGLSGGLTPPPSPVSSGSQEAVFVAPTARGGAPVFSVWLASYRSPTSARSRWIQLQRQFDDLLSPLSPVFPRVEVPGQGSFVRLYAGAFQTRQEAEGLCAAIRERGPTEFCDIVER